VKELEFAQASRVLRQEEERLTFFKKRRDHYQQQLVDRQTAGMNPGEIAIYRAYAEYVKEKIQWQIEALETARKQVEQKKGELLAAQKDRKILDRLRERKHRAFLLDTQRQERKDIDEVALGRFQGGIRDRRR
jgi:flagellar FliJ protein